jgi:hypothetical protein
MTKSGYVLTADAIGQTEMPPDVRIALVERLVSLYKQDNAKFDADRFRFMARVFKCKNCDEVTTDRLANHHEHTAQVHPELVV